MNECPRCERLFSTGYKRPVLIGYFPDEKGKLQQVIDICPTCYKECNPPPKKEKRVGTHNLDQYRINQSRIGFRDGYLDRSKLVKGHSKTVTAKVSEVYHVSQPPPVRNTRVIPAKEQAGIVSCSAEERLRLLGVKRGFSGQMLEDFINAGLGWRKGE